MNLDIQTEHVLMQPEWHKVIEEWVALCAKSHPDVGVVDLTLRHGDHEHDGNRVDALAVARGRTLRAGGQGQRMDVALRNALDGLEREMVALGRERMAA